VNYFEHHIGDYDEATAHLTACEDGIYHRLLRKYYATEKPLISDIGKLQRLVRAKAKDEKKAVVDVLEEFFKLEDNGWHHKRCDKEIAAYLIGEPERAVKKTNEETRLRRHREERSRLFSIINAAGEHASWNTPTAQLREHANRVAGNHPETKPATPATQPETACATPATATHTPVPIHQTPDTTPQSPTNNEDPPIPPEGGEGDPASVPDAKPKRQRRPPSVLTAETAELFEFWYRRYPRKAARKKAFAAFIALAPTREDVLRWIAAIEAQGLASKVKQDGTTKFIPLPASWLNGRRWEDEAKPVDEEALFADAQRRSGARGVVDLSNPKPEWALQAGFPNRFVAENAQCFEHNAHEFRDGQRSQGAAA